MNDQRPDNRHPGFEVMPRRPRRWPLVFLLATMAFAAVVVAVFGVST